MIQAEDVQALLQVHRFQEERFFNREAFNGFCAWLTVLIMWELADWRESERRCGIDPPPRCWIS